MLHVQGRGFKDRSCAIVHVEVEYSQPTVLLDHVKHGRSWQWRGYVEEGDVVWAYFLCEFYGSPSAFLTVIFTHGFALMVMFAIPLLIGLIWNKWAGGATGFLTGTLYYLANAGYNIQYSVINFGSSPNLYADPAFIGDYIVCGILIGYITGALNNKSYNFKRMLGAGLTAAITVGVISFVLNMTVSTAAWMARADPFTAFYQVLLPMVILGIIAPIIAKVFTWYGIYPGGHT